MKVSQKKYQNSVNTKTFTHSTEQEELQFSSAESEQAFKQHIKQFSTRLEEHGLNLVSVISDGNCLLRAIADQIEGNENMHHKYRHLAIQEMQKYKKFYQLFLPDSLPITKYLKLMQQDGVWAGHLEIQALCNVLKVDIAVHGLNGSFLIEYEQKPTIKQNILYYIKQCFSCLKVNQVNVNHQKFDQKQRRKIINIAYHRGKQIIEHYSSIRYQNDTDKAPAKSLPIQLVYQLLQNKQKVLAQASTRIREDFSPQESFENDKDLILPLQQNLKIRRTQDFDFQQQFLSNSTSIK